MRRLVFASPALVPALASASAPLVRFPTSSATALAFVARGALWTSPRDGEMARMLFGGAGSISFPRFSPDGSLIAFTRRLHGAQDVFVVSLDGRNVRRLTSDGRTGPADNVVVGWSPDGRRVLFLSTRSSVAAKQIQAFSVDRDGGAALRLPLDQAGRLDVSPTDGRIAYARTFTDLAARKRYVGGMAEDIWLYDPLRATTRRLTDWRGTDTAPMWSDRAMYFLSDRGPGFRMNLWKLDAEGSPRRLTGFEDFDVDWPSMGGGRIVFQQGGGVWSLDLRTERLRRLRIAFPVKRGRSDRMEPAAPGLRLTDATGSADYTPLADGSGAVVAARGDLFVVTARGPWRNLTATFGRDEDHPTVSPDGAAVAYVTEDARAQQIALRPLRGGPECVLTAFADTVLYAPSHSRRALLSCEAVLTSAAALAGPGIAASLLLAFAMGGHNALILRAGRIGVSLTYVTGTLVHLGRALASRMNGGPVLEAWPHLASWTALLLGAWSGAVAFRLAKEAALLPIAGILIALAVVEAVRGGRHARRERTTGVRRGG